MQEPTIKAEPRPEPLWLQRWRNDPNAQRVVHIATKGQRKRTRRARKAK